MNQLDYQRKIQANLERYRIDIGKERRKQKMVEHWIGRVPLILTLIFLSVLVIFAVNRYNEIKAVKTAEIRAAAKAELTKVRCEQGIEKYREMVLKMAIRDVKKQMRCRGCKADRSTFSAVEEKYDVLFEQMFKGSIANILPANADKIWKDSWEKS